MLEETQRIDVHDVRFPDSVPPRLEMYQAGSGDLLRIVTPNGSIIIDSGPAAYAGKLLQLLNDAGSPCRLLILTHLDADHFGGLQTLVSELLNGHFTRVRWPEVIWVNEFEPRNAVNAVLGCVGETPEGAEEAWARCSRLVGAGELWREEADQEIGSTRGLEVPDEIEIVIDADPLSFQYLKTISSADWLTRVKSEVALLEVLRDTTENLSELPIDLLRRLERYIRDIDRALEKARAEISAHR